MNSLNLIILHSCVNCLSIKELLRIVLLCDFVSVEYWVFFAEILIIMRPNNAVYGLTIER